MFPIQTTVVSRHPPVVTWLIIGLNVSVFFFELHLPPETLERFTYLFGVVPARFTHPEWASWVGFPIDNHWPFLTSMFLHAGWLHIVGNMWTLWVFGMHVEDRMGLVRYFLFYLLCGIGSGVVHMTVNADSTVPAIGASGAIAGVMGAYLLMFPLSRVIVMNTASATSVDLDKFCLWNVETIRPRWRASVTSPPMRALIGQFELRAGSG